jgi:hypothetical protein
MTHFSEHSRKYMSTTQSYVNHTRYNTLHHFVITPLSLILIIWSVVLFFQSDLGSSVKLFLVLAAIVLTLIAIIARLYALKVQDRIIRLEMRQRYFELSGSSFTKFERTLSLKQIIALRFASDEELIALIDRTADEGLSPKSIKMHIMNWKADNLRV